MIMLALYVFFAVCVCCAIVTDFRSLRIPNWIPLALIAGFVVFAASGLSGRAALAHVLVAAITFLITLALFLARWIAGGDVKFLTAVMLWIGPADALSFLLAMTLLGAGLSIALVTLHRFALFAVPDGYSNSFLNRMLVLAEERKCPYGVAIGLAGLLMVAGSTAAWSSLMSCH